MLRGLEATQVEEPSASSDGEIKDDLAKQGTTEKGTDRNETTRPIDIKWRKHNREN